MTSDEQAIPDLKESRTYENLKAAFAQDAQAAGRYAYFAARADVEGHLGASGALRAAAQAETARVQGHLDFLRGVGDPQTGAPIGTVEEALLSAIERENYAAELLYAGFARTAREEGFEAVAEWFQTLSRAGQVQARHLQRELDRVRLDASADAPVAASPAPGARKRK